MKPIVLAAFSDHVQSLPHLDEEVKRLNHEFNTNRKQVRYIDLNEYDPQWIFKNLDSHARDLRLFYFSGHSSSQVLRLYKGDMYKTSFVEKINSLAEENKLQCVILNGCSNYEIVKKLDKVPVVIGTETDVQDHIATEFGQSFFKNLIDNKMTYQAAFKSALATAKQAGQKVINGQITYRSNLSDSKYLEYDKWVCIEKEEGLAARLKFDFGASVARWIALGLIPIMAILVFLFWSDISFRIKGFKNPGFGSDKDCKILIEDFYENENVNDFVVDGILQNETINEFIEPIAINNFSDILYPGSKLNQNDIPNKLNIDFNVYGEYTKKDDNPSVIRYRTYPNLNVKNKYTVHYIQSDGDIRDIFSELSPDFRGEDLMSNICLTCSYQNKDLLPEVEKVIDNQSIVNPEGGQKSNLQLASSAEKHGNQEFSLKILDKVSARSAPDNDFSLIALDRSAEIRLENKDYNAAFDDHSKILLRLDRRVNNSPNVSRHQTPQFYHTKYNEFRLKRAENVRLNRFQMAAGSNFNHKQIQTALADYRYLNRINYNNQLYGSKIQELLKLQNVLDSDNDGYTIQQGDCDDQNAKINPGSDELCNGIDDDCDGQTDEGCPIDNDGDGFTSDKDCNDNNAKIHPDQNEICGNKVDDNCNGRIDEGCLKKYTVVGKISSCDHSVPDISSIFIELVGKRKVNDGVFRFTTEVIPNTSLKMTLPNAYQFYKTNNYILLKEELNPIVNISVQPVLDIPGKMNVTGKIVDEKLNPIIGVSVIVRGSTNGTITDIDGVFSLSGVRIDPCHKELLIRYTGYETINIDVIKSNLGRIILK